MVARSIRTEGLLDFINAAAPGSDAALKRLQTIANLLDSAFLIPGTNQRVGIDALIGLVPGLGDIVVRVGQNAREPRHPSVVGSVPVFATCLTRSSASISATCAFFGLSL